MPCTTILVGKKASYDGSTMIARNDDSPSGQFTPKKFVVVHPEEQPRKYKSVLSHVEIDLPEEALRYTAVPNALEGEGIWAAHGINAAGVGMTATETITSMPESWEQIRWWNMFRRRMVQKRFPEVSVRRTLYLWCSLIFIVPEKVSRGWEVCWKNTAPMR